MRAAKNRFADGHRATTSKEVRILRKLGKLFSGEAYARTGRKLRRALTPIPIPPLLRKIDKQRLSEIQQRYADSPENYAKYADVERWLRRHSKRVQDLHLHRSSPKEILDLGCGGGFFLFIAKQFGHSVQGLDIDEFPLLGELVALMEVPRKVWRIEAFKALPDFGRQFDLITAFSTRFNRDAQDRHVWGVQEWEFFLDDLARNIKPGGEVFLEINSGKMGQYYPRDVQELFRRRGASLERDYVYFRRGIKATLLRAAIRGDENAE
ncbi:MAG: methyltransferase domain-containing protein [Spartobacteria bacterium]